MNALRLLRRFVDCGLSSSRVWRFKDRRFKTELGLRLLERAQVAFVLRKPQSGFTALRVDTARAADVARVWLAGGPGAGRAGRQMRALHNMPEPAGSL
jgi:hypothetical protein